ncbi:prephenate dehydratase [Paenibacillus macquariensis]|uniref:Prephenate dehydratase n=1 Tax=Paenibacillus macquariensis TaxID=948756 RepID=A0ABY1JTH5_9BACL|nr:prephenate dehydratase [Paenibacillus macquariensis]MEC0093133.1 prephenate dehydratase [Paenibacillus macquariensis]OAB36474.1 prephenate dehydratase [Paenibacillus macquariensis subsp. macquariensis]SIQ73376.1 prephenate dehydratase [Paenibacillus macquariensis]
MKRIALLPEGSVSHEAIVHLFGDEPVELLYYKQISDVFRSTVLGKSDYSVIPIENTIDGSVSLHMDWLVNEVDIPMQAEWVYPSIQNLIGDQEAFLSEDGEMDYSKITKIISHPVAAAQCMQFIRKHAPQAEVEHAGSTSEAVHIVKKNPGQGWTAIGTVLGAAKYKLDVMAERVTDHDNNFTRFVLIGSDPARLQRESNQMKTSVTVTLPEDFPGALHQVLSAFAWRRLNLSRIESRPTKKKLGNYYFYIDVLAEDSTVLLQAAIAEIEALGCQVRVLGSYPCYAYDKNPEVK